MAVVYGQVVLGAFTTHGTAVWWHVAGAVVATGVLVGPALAVLRGAGRGSGPRLVGARREGARPGPARSSGSAPTPFASRASGCRAGSSPSSPCRSLHRAVGALVLGSAVALALQLGRRRALGAGARAAPRAVAGADGGAGVTSPTAVVRDGALALGGDPPPAGGLSRAREAPRRPDGGADDARRVLPRRVRGPRLPAAGPRPRGDGPGGRGARWRSTSSSSGTWTRGCCGPARGPCRTGVSSRARPPPSAAW